MLHAASYCALLFGTNNGRDFDSPFVFLLFCFLSSLGLDAVSLLPIF